MIRMDKMTLARKILTKMAPLILAIQMTTATAFLTNAMSTPLAELTVIKMVKMIPARTTPMVTAKSTPVIPMMTATASLMNVMSI